MHMGSEVDLCDCGIHSVPMWLSEREGIRVLHMSNNQITGLPPTCASYAGMVRVDLKNNPLREPAQWINLCVNIEVLDLGRAFADLLAPLEPIQLEKVRFDHLKKLRVLSLRNHGLREIPPSLCACAGLEKLDVSFNAIEELPPQVQTMPSLRHLNAAFNFLTEVRTPPQMDFLCVAYNPVVLGLQFIFCRARNVCANGIPVEALYSNGITTKLVVSAHLSLHAPASKVVVRDKPCFEAQCIESTGYSRRNCLVRMLAHVDEINLVCRARSNLMPVRLPATLQTAHYF
jgi:hypothetical protein